MGNPRRIQHPSPFPLFFESPSNSTGSNLDRSHIPRARRAGGDPPDPLPRAHGLDPGDPELFDYTSLVKIHGEYEGCIYLAGDPEHQDAITTSVERTLGLRIPETVFV